MNFLLSWPTAEQLNSSTSSQQTDAQVIYVADVTEELSESVLLHLENERCGGGQTEHSLLMEDGTLMAKFVDTEG